MVKENISKRKLRKKIFKTQSEIHFNKLKEMYENHCYLVRCVKWVELRFNDGLGSFLIGDSRYDTIRYEGEILKI